MSPSPSRAQCGQRSDGEARAHLHDGIWPLRIADLTLEAHELHGFKRDDAFDYRRFAFARFFAAPTTPMHSARRVHGPKYVPRVGFDAAGRLTDQHLSPSSLDGPGAVGLAPSFPLRQDGDSFRTIFAVLDFDRVGIAEVMRFAASVQTPYLRPLVSSGTTGRGAHVYLRFRAPIPTHVAHALLRAVADQAEQHGLPRPELRPSSAAGVGSVILLPYRGAARDGYGANPLVDPQTGEAMRLDELLARADLYSDPARAIAHSKRRLLKDVLEQARCARDTSEAASSGDRAQDWQAVLRKVKPRWTRGRRNHLTLALSAYGLGVLRLTPERVERDILAIAANAADEELDRRQQAVIRTGRRIANGERVAIRQYLDLAHVRPALPGLRADAATVHAVADAVTNIAKQARLFPGPGGPGERAVLRQLAEAARRWGHSTSDMSVRISISRRQLAEKCGQEASATNRVLSRLARKGYVRLLPSPAQRPDLPGTIELRAASEHRDGTALAGPAAAKPPTGGGGQYDWEHFDHPAFRTGALGRSAADLAAALADDTREPTVARLIHRTGLSEPTVRRALRRLHAHDVVTRKRRGRSHVYAVADHVKERLDAAAEYFGLKARFAATKDRHEDERIAFQRYRLHHYARARRGVASYQGFPARGMRDAARRALSHSDTGGVPRDDVGLDRRKPRRGKRIRTNRLGEVDRKWSSGSATASRDGRRVGRPQSAGERRGTADPPFAAPADSAQMGGSAAAREGLP